MNRGMLIVGALLTAFGFFMAWIFVSDIGMKPISTDDLESLSDDIIDELMDAGLFRPGIRYDDPLLTEQRTILIARDVNSHVAEAVTAKLLYLTAKDPKAPIELYIRTWGGWADDARAICDVIRRIDAPVNTWAIGGCRSAGTVILAAGTGTRRALPNTLISLHVNEEPGDAAFSAELATRRRAERFWRARAKLPEDFFPMDYEKTYYFTAEEALKYGIIDEIYRAKAPAEDK